MHASNAIVTSTEADTRQNFEQLSSGSQINQLSDWVIKKLWSSTVQAPLCIDGIESKQSNASERIVNK